MPPVIDIMAEPRQRDDELIKRERNGLGNVT